MRTTIIAEAGVNHNGSLELALELVDAAAAAGADVVKFQTFVPEKVISKFAAKAEYQIQTTPSSESQLEMVAKLTLDYSAHQQLKKRAAERNIELLSSPFDLGSIDLLSKLGVSRLKIPSGEITNGPLLLKAAATGLPLIVSTGMSTLSEIELALRVIAYGYINPQGKPSLQVFSTSTLDPEAQEVLSQRVSLLHCNTAYPTEISDANLAAIETLQQKFNLPVGYSDHTEGILVPLAAVARGAVIIEKHLTLDRNLEGPDHRASLEPRAMKSMVAAIRIVEMSIGSAEKTPTESELKNLPIARKSLVAGRPIEAGEKFTAENLEIKRPGSGVSPMQYWNYLGKVSRRSYQQDEIIENQED